jgi:aryl-alcohol dehydrogenase-like predicted oxidoreductase
VKIATKLGAEPTVVGGWPEQRQGLSAAAVRTALAGSLDRLGVDSVDLLWLHQEDRSVPIEETVDAISDFVAMGTVDRVGASNHPAWRIERARQHAINSGTCPIDALQLSTSYLRPRPGTLPPGNVHRFGVLDDEHVDLAAENDIELWAYTPLLSGAYDNRDKQFPEVFDHPGSTRRLAALHEVSAALGMSRSQVKLAWLVGRSPSIRPILGGSKIEQLDIALRQAECRGGGCRNDAARRVPPTIGRSGLTARLWIANPGTCRADPPKLY